MNRFTTAAHVLRLLVSSDEPVVLDSTDPIRDVLLTAAEACEQVDAADKARDEALGAVVELRKLLDRTADMLSMQPLPTEGGAWPLFTLTGDIRRALERAEQEQQCW